MWLVLCAANDFPALWTARQLERRGLKPLEIVTPEGLAYCSQFIHRLRSGRASTQIKLTDGRVIDSAAIRGTLNRLQLVPNAHLRAASAADRHYAEQELYALYLSWLNGLPGVMVNRPTPGGLSGEWRHYSEWVWLAARAGLATLEYVQSDRRPEPVPSPAASPASKNILVIPGGCFGAAVPATVARGCQRLLQSSDTSLLGLTFSSTHENDWTFINATPFPDLRIGGDSFVDGLAAALS